MLCQYAGRPKRPESNRVPGLLYQLASGESEDVIPHFIIYKDRTRRRCHQAICSPWIKLALAQIVPHRRAEWGELPHLVLQVLRGIVDSGPKGIVDYQLVVLYRSREIKLTIRFGTGDIEVTDVNEWSLPRAGIRFFYTH